MQLSSSSLVSHNETFPMNSFLYNYENSKKSYVSPKEYQKRSLPYNNCNNNTTLVMPSLLSSRKVTKKAIKSKKIILGKPILDGKQKMSLQELKALSRQIKPVNKQQDILKMSRNLRENLHKAKSKMMDNLKKSNTPKDVEIYEFLNKENLIEGDDIRLVTDESGSLSVSSSCSSSSSVSSLDNQSLMNETLFEPLYTPSIMNMELFLQSSSPFWTPKTISHHNDVTEDQIDSWLQRGGFGDHMSPMIMATDQELADLLDFDM